MGSTLVELVASFLDAAVAAALTPLTWWICLSGLDDLFVLLVFVAGRSWRSRGTFGPEADAEPPRKTAIFVPCWREEAVIADMIRHNLSAIRHPDYEFFVGCYPNDDATVRVVRELEAQAPRVHLCLCPHDGPTSKADCLNWIYQRMLVFEEAAGRRHQMVVIHDAEDLIHPDELAWMNRLAAGYDMIQTPVLPLPTPAFELTHGFYCDDFAESHSKDLVVRQALGGFIPSCGVGTGYTRDAIERLAVAGHNRVFEPGCLTEDYENGLRLGLLDCRQFFLPLQTAGGTPMATREYFPRGFRGAVRQRSRWVTGIALQSWRRHGWPGGGRQWYWLWRDRKGLVSNPAGLLANLMFVYGAATWVASVSAGAEWKLAAAVRDPFVGTLLAANGLLQVIHLAARMLLCGRIYGWRFALAAPLRTAWGNWLNTAATASALWVYARATLRREPLVWVKTEHAYPSRAALLPHKRTLDEILVGSGYLTAEQLACARSTQPPGVSLPDYLIASGLAGEDDVYEALSLQLGLAFGWIDPHTVHRRVARALPAHVVRKWAVLPVKIEAGNLHLASPEPPPEELPAVLRRFTRLEIQVQLVTPSNFRSLAEALL